MLFSVFVGWALLAAQPTQADPIRWGWGPRSPYLLEEKTVAGTRFTGLDAEILGATFARMGATTQPLRLPWNETIDGLKSGAVGIASGAYHTPERDAFAFFSEPYREEEAVLLARSPALANWDAETTQEMFARLRTSAARVAWVSGFYYGPEAAALGNSPEMKGRIRETLNDDASFEALLEGQVEAVLADRLVADAFLYHLSEHGKDIGISEYPIPVYRAPVHVMFSRKVFSLDQVERFNATVGWIRTSGEYSRIVAQYLFPTLLQISTGRPWFFILVVIGTVAAAIQGAMIARERGYSLVGAIVAAILISLGGGLIRDVFLGRFPVMVVRTPALLLFSSGTAVLVVALLRVFKIGSVNSRTGVVNSIVDVCDALSLGALSVAGVMAALEVKAEPLALWGPILAAITAGGGGILVNILLGEGKHHSLISAFYLEISLLWGLLLSLFLMNYTLRGYYETRHVLAAVVITTIGGSATRLWAIRAGWKGLRI